MHKPWFIAFTKKKKLNVKLLSDCAEYFSVSLSAAAFRYAEIGNAPCAIVFSSRGIVKWSIVIYKNVAFFLLSFILYLIFCIFLISNF